MPGNYSLPNYVTEEVITEMQNGWDLDKVKAGNMETLKGINVTAEFTNLEACEQFIVT